MDTVSGLTPGFFLDQIGRSVLSAAVLTNSVHWKTQTTKKIARDRINDWFAPVARVDARVAGNIEVFRVIFPAVKIQYYVYQGSRDWADFITNAKFWLTRAQDFRGRIHSGFNDAHIKHGYWHIQQIWCELQSDYQTILVGHSQGGAMAQLAAVTLGRLLGVRLPVITFGSPVVGDREWGQHAMRQMRHVRVQLEWDIITWINRWLGEHAADVHLHVGHHGLRHSQKAPRWSMCETAGSALSSTRLDPISAHAPWAYESRLAQNLPGYAYDR